MLLGARFLDSSQPCLARVLWRQVELNTRGRHLLVEYNGCNLDILDDLKRIEGLMRDAAVAAGTRIVASVFQPFDPHGVTGVVVVEESHLSIHTWPESGYAAVDFFTCGDSLPEAAHRVLLEGLDADRAEKIFVERGLSQEGPAMRMRSHTTEHRRPQRVERAQA